MPWAIAFMGYAAGAFPPCRTSFSDFLKAAHTLALAQAEGAPRSESSLFQGNGGERV